MWFLIPVAAVLGKVAYDYFTDDNSPAAPSQSDEQQKRDVYLQKQKEIRLAEIRRQLCTYATVSANTLIDRCAGASLKGEEITLDNIISFNRAKTDTPVHAVEALSALTGARIKLGRKREQQQLNKLEKELDRITELIEQLEREKEKFDDHE